MKKILIILILILLLLWISVFLTDYILYKNNNSPIFYVSASKEYDGRNYSAFCLGYRVNCYYLFGQKKMEFGPFSMLYDSLKYFPTDSTEPHF